MAGRYSNVAKKSRRAAERLRSRRNRHASQSSQVVMAAATAANAGRANSAATGRRTTGRSNAENARASAEEIIAGAKRYAADKSRDQKFTKHPSTWLNADCWLDEATNNGWKPPVMLDAPKRTWAEIQAEKREKGTL